jgi:hypothetical protein
MKKIIILSSLLCFSIIALAQNSPNNNATAITEAKQRVTIEDRTFPMTAAQYAASKTAANQKKAAEQAKSKVDVEQKATPQAPVSTKGTSLEATKPNSN